MRKVQPVHLQKISDCGLIITTKKKLYYAETLTPDLAEFLIFAKKMGIGIDKKLQFKTFIELDYKAGK